MKFFLLLGGFVGFVLAFAASWNAGNSAAQALRDGAIGCLAGAVLLRGLHAVFHITVRNHLAREIVRVRDEVAAAKSAEGTI
jgi:hypothetical protein